jgi:cytochrome c553
MSFCGVRWVLAAFAIVAVGLPAAGAAESASTGVSHGSFQGKFQYCGYCHGSAGQGYRGYYAIPRLAGQQPDYIVNQLRAFIERRRDNHLSMRMYRVHGVGSAMQAALAERFSHLHPKPYGAGPSRLMAEGKKIFEEGVPETNVPACGACHGLSAQGAGQNPRLAGQLYAYTTKNLINWASERGQDHSRPDSSAIMLPIVRNMSKAQISAVAAYVSSLK